MVSLPRSARLAAWFAAWLRDHVSIDDVVARVQGDDEPHQVSDMPDTLHSVSLTEASWELRADGATGLAVTLPAPGDPCGLGGPAPLNGLAIDAGEAVVTVGAAAQYALVPEVQTFGPPGDHGHLVTWHCHRADPPPSGLSLADADRAMTDALREAPVALDQLEVAAWRPEVAALLDDVRSSRDAEPLPRRFPPEAQSTAARAARLLAVVRFALDDGPVTTGGSERPRQTALDSLERTARHALMAACNVWASP